VDLSALRSAKVFARTGKISTRDDARAVAVAVCKLAGLSDRETERRTGVNATTVPAVMRALEASGTIPSAHQRLTQSLGELAESSASEMQRIIRNADGEWAAGGTNALRSLSIAMGIAIDKHQLLTGQATAIVEQRSGPSADQVAEWEGKLRQVFGLEIDVTSPPPDAQSVDHSANLQLIGPFRDGDTPLATPKPPHGRDLAQLAELEPAPGDQGAGGVAPGDGGGDGRRVPSNNL